ncbi:flagellar hook-basal body complex protein FliE [Clostridium mediterraneense]|uniref:flagellar hook-basal body complex protein FliE n=1 Tax=Clostridium mediterraneense TaxID=1805472 RepID=UPI000830E08F|nr:flagellar hook-basal body complex protein FliE [Clostridium mediterraneense]
MNINTSLINTYNKVSDINSNLFLNKVDKEESLDKSNNSFSNILKDSLDKVNNKQIESDILTQKMIRGDEEVSIHEVMLAGEEAKLSLQLAMQVRNKLVEAYQEISRTQI